VTQTVVQPGVPNPDARSHIAALADVLLSRMPQLTDRLVVEISRLEPAYGSLAVVPADDLWRSCHDNLRDVVSSLREDPDHVPPDLDAPRATGQRRAEQGLPVESLLHSYRLGGRVIWEALAEEARRGSPESLDWLIDGATHVWQIIDIFSAAVADSYRRTEAELSRHNQQRAQSVVDALLEGRPDDPRLLRTACAVLDLPERGSFVVVVLETASSTRSWDWTAGLRSARTVRVDREIGVVALDDSGLPALLERLGQLRWQGRIGVSPPCDGLRGLAAAHRLAELALQTQEPGSSGVAQLNDNLPAALVLSSPELADLLRRDVLGPVLALDADEQRVLLETLQVYVESGASALRTAHRLFCHRNTVLNRLRRLESVLDRSLSAPSDLLDVVLALHTLRLLPPR
jgi:hypothetical protein